MDLIKALRQSYNNFKHTIGLYEYVRMYSLWACECESWNNESFTDVNVFFCIVVAVIIKEVMQACVHDLILYLSVFMTGLQKLSLMLYSALYFDIKL